MASLAYPLEVTPAGEWDDEVARLGGVGGLVDWLVGRRGSVSGRQPEAPTSKVTHEGYAEKLGSWRRNWKKRWFRLTPTSLVYYESGGGAQQQRKVALGELQLVSEPQDDGMVTLAQVWDYRAALSDGHTNATQALLQKYSPPRTPGMAPATPQYEGLRALQATSSELSRCFGIRCAATQRDLFLKADSDAAATEWVEHIQRSAATAAQFETPLCCLNDSDELRALLAPGLQDGDSRPGAPPLQPPGLLGATQAAAEAAPPPPPRFDPESILGLGLAISIESGNILYSTEDAFFVSVYSGTFPLTLTSLPQTAASAVIAAKAAAARADQSCYSARRTPTGAAAWGDADQKSIADLLVTAAFTLVATTESIKAKDVGAFDHPSRSVLTRQFTVLVPPNAAAPNSHSEHLLFVVYRMCSSSEDLQSQEIIGFAYQELTDLRQLLFNSSLAMAASVSPTPLLVPLKLFAGALADPPGDELRGAAALAASHATASAAAHGTLAMSAVPGWRAQKAPLELYSEPVALASFRFHGLRGAKVVACTECFVPTFAVSVPLAVLSLICSERLPLVEADRARLAAKRAALDRSIARQQDELAKYSAVLASTSSDHEDGPRKIERNQASETILFLERALHSSREHRAVLVAESAKLDEFQMVLSDYQECLELYHDLLVLHRGFALSDDARARAAASVIDPVEQFRARERYILKRSTKKGDGRLKFLPTNLVLELVRAREASGTALDRPQVARAHEIWSTIATVTLGCPAAHSLGFKGGGLRRILARGSAGFDDDATAERRILRLMDWTIPRDQISAIEADKRERLATEREVVHEVLARRMVEDHEALILAAEGPVTGRRDGSLLLPYLAKALGEEAPGTGAASSRSELRDSLHGGPRPLASADAHDLLMLVQRLDVVTTQFIAAAVTQVTALLEAAAFDSVFRPILAVVLRAGFLVSVQSLLSTRGDELGMLEDLVAASEWLSSVEVRLVHRREARKESISSQDSNDFPGTWVRRHRSSGGLVVDIEVFDTVAKVVYWGTGAGQLKGGGGGGGGGGGSGGLETDADPILIGGGDGTAWVLLATIPLVSVVFQQGINEQQVVSNALDAGALALQAQVNSESFARLEAHVLAFRAAASSPMPPGCSLEGTIREVDIALELLRKDVDSALKTNVNLILHASTLCRHLSGVRGR